MFSGASRQTRGLSPQHSWGEGPGEHPSLFAASLGPGMRRTRRRKEDDLCTRREEERGHLTDDGSSPSLLGCREER